MLACFREGGEASAKLGRTGDGGETMRGDIVDFTAEPGEEGLGPPSADLVGMATGVDLSRCWISLFRRSTSFCSGLSGGESGGGDVRTFVLLALSAQNFTDSDSCISDLLLGVEHFGEEGGHFAETGLELRSRYLR